MTQAVMIAKKSSEPTSYCPMKLRDEETTGQRETKRKRKLLR